MQVRVIRHSPRGKLPPCDPNGRLLCRCPRPHRQTPFLINLNTNTRNQLCANSQHILDRPFRLLRTWQHAGS